MRQDAIFAGQWIRTSIIYTHTFTLLGAYRTDFRGMVTKGTCQLVFVDAPGKILAGCGDERSFVCN